MKRRTRLTILMLIILITTMIGNAVIAQDDDDEENFTALDYLEQGMSYYGDQDYELAIAEFTSALELDSELADAYFYRALTTLLSWLSEDQQMVDDINSALEYELDS